MSNSERIYINCSITNTTNQPINAVYNQTFQQAILQNCSDYYFTINRFSISGAAIPLMIFPIQKNQSNPNLSTLLFTFTYDNITYPQYVIYAPENDLITSAPSQNVSLNFYQSLSPYYFVFSIQDLIDMFNTAVASAFTAVKTANPGIPQTEAPYFIYDAPTKLISLITQYSFSDTMNPLTLSVNYALYKYLSSFQYLYNSSSTDGSNYTFVLNDNANNHYALPGATLPTPPTNPDYLQFIQEYDSSSDWISLQSLVITTNQIPIRGEIIPISIDQSPSSNFISNNSLQIVSDFVPEFQGIGDVSSIYNYQPTILRMINILDDKPMMTLDFQIWFMDSFNNLYPLQLLPFTTASIKVGFYKKSSFFG